MLSFAEEVYLLSLDNTSGKVELPGGTDTLNCALVGAVLCELSYLNRIDCDRDGLFLISHEQTGDSTLDDIIDIIELRGRKETVSFWLKNLLPEAPRIEKKIRKKLVQYGIIKIVEEKIFWIFPSKRYPIIDNEEIKDVERRLHDIITNDIIPDPRDAVLISLVRSCGLFSKILSSAEREKCEQRINQLSSLDCIGRETCDLIRHLTDAGAFPRESGLPLRTVS